MIAVVWNALIYSYNLGVWIITTLNHTIDHYGYIFFAPPIIMNYICQFDQVHIVKQLPKYWQFTLLCYYCVKYWINLQKQYDLVRFNKETLWHIVRIFSGLPLIIYMFCSMKMLYFAGFIHTNLTSELQNKYYWVKW